MTVTLHTPNIMVVDDTPANLRLLDDLLRQQGYQVRLFPRGGLALKAATANPPDLILLDIMMPDMDGFEVCHQLKAVPALRDVPVIFISALADSDNKVKAFEHGGMDYVTKPFQEAEVLARVRTHLALRAAQQAQRNQQAELERLVDERTADLLRAQRVAHIGSWKLDLRTQALSWTPETYHLFGVPEGKALVLDDFLAKVHPEDRDLVSERWALALQGQPYDVEHRITPPAGATWVRERAEIGIGPDGQAHTVWGTAQDISAAKAHQARVDFITHHDELTGLPNRTCFVELLRVCMNRAVTLQQKLAVAYIDLDGFAALDAQLGREQGNKLLVELGTRLAQAVRDSQYLGRIGGDEFAVVLPGLRSPGDHQTPVQRLLQAVAQPLNLGKSTVHLTASIGVSIYPQTDAVEAEQLLRQADQAMYLAKLAGKNRHHLFDPLKDETTRERFMRIEELRKGLDNGEMRLHYQPKVWLSSGQVAGFEALIRWVHPQRGMVPPAQFIPLLEQHPLAITLGNWVIEAALAQLAEWNAHGFVTCVSVNIESQQLQDPDFVARLQRQLASYPGVSPRQLELEILETGALNNMAQVSLLIADVQHMGVACSLDDFGTGFSSLTFLKQLGAQTIKIDQSFVRGMLDDGEHASIVHSVLGLARSFDRHTLAEGVETLAHGHMLLELGCELAQGYAIARPMPAADVPAWTEHWHLPDEWANVNELDPSDVNLLMAEVEHRQWLRELKTHVQHPDQAQPPMGAQDCKFGHWLARASTARRLGHLPAFADVVRLHREMHELANRLLVSAPSAPPAAHWHELDAASQRMVTAMHQIKI